MFLKKTIAALAAGCLAFSLASCSNSESSSEAGGSTQSANYITARGSEPQNPLIPGNTNEVGGGNIVDLIYSGLVYYDADGNTHNDMAESIDLEGEKTYRVTLKDGITFSDGSPVTSESFVKAWNKVVEDSMLTADFFEPILGFKDGAASMEGLKVVDDKTFTIELNQPEADFPTRLGYSAFYPMHESAFDDLAAYGENPIGNGPYKLAEWNHNKDAIIVPNEEYKGDRVPCSTPRVTPHTPTCWPATSM